MGVKHTRPQRFWQRIWRAGIRELVVVAVAALCVRAFVAETKLVPTESMAPTLQPGDRVVVEKITYRFRTPVRGEIVAFRPPLPDAYDHVKRVVAVAGDRVMVADGRFYVNGRSELPGGVQCPACPAAAFTVPAGKLFVLGDNRDNSVDSRMWGFLDVNAVKGRVVFRFWPPARAGWLRSQGEGGGDLATFSTARGPGLQGEP